MKQFSVIAGGPVLLVLLVCLSSPGQTINLTGKLTDTTGKAVTGAVVTLSKAHLADTTDQNGAFVLKGEPVSAHVQKRFTEYRIRIAISHDQIRISDSRGTINSVSLFSLQGDLIQSGVRAAPNGETVPRLSDVLPDIFLCVLHGAQGYKAYAVNRIGGSFVSINYQAPVNNPALLAKCAAASTDTLLFDSQGTSLGKFVLSSMVMNLGTLRARSPKMSHSLILDIDGKGTPMVFSYIPAGTFTMGSPAAEYGHGAPFGDPETLHKVTITKPYYMGIYEVTQKQWKAVMGFNPSGNFPSDPGPHPSINHNLGDTLPTDHVLYSDAKKLGEKISTTTGRKVRMPTEAEWEMAYRAGTQTAYYYGNSAIPLPKYAWFSQGFRVSHACGKLLPNDYGLYDIAGNIWEFVSDMYAYYSTADQTDPVGPSGGSTGVFRGGCAFNDAKCQRAASRHSIGLGYTDPAIGVRMLCEAK